eukprot:SAG31_NODE_2488_length_5620_cov_2.020830_2_plen_151_part_00
MWGYMRHEHYVFCTQLEREKKAGRRDGERMVLRIRQGLEPEPEASPPTARVGPSLFFYKILTLSRRPFRQRPRRPLSRPPSSLSTRLTDQPCARPLSLPRPLPTVLYTLPVAKSTARARTMPSAMLWISAPALSTAVLKAGKGLDPATKF